MPKHVKIVKSVESPVSTSRHNSYDSPAQKKTLLMVLFSQVSVFFALYEVLECCASHSVYLVQMILTEMPQVLTALKRVLIIRLSA